MINVTRYSALQRKLHWLVVLLVAVQYLSQSVMREAMLVLESQASLNIGQFLVTTMHSWGGAAIAAIMGYRLWLRRLKPVRVGAGRISGVQQWLAEWLHRSFYVVLIFMALTGAGTYYVDITWTAQAHWLGKWVLAALVTGHVLAALLHHFWKKDGVLRQMR